MTDSTGDSDREGRREDGTIVVPMRMYKGITVFSTLVATGLVVLGFFFFDAATRTDNLIRTSVSSLVGLTGWTPPTQVLNVSFGLLGVAVIVLGAGSYILGTRFKTAEMVDADDEQPTAAEQANEADQTETEPTETADAEDPDEAQT